MKISERGRITIPKALRDMYGLTAGTDVDVMPTEGGILVRKKAIYRHPVDEIAGILSRPMNTDDYLDSIRGTVSPTPKPKS